MLKKNIQNAIVFALAAITLFSCVACGTDNTSPLRDPNYLELSENTAPIITVGDPKIDEGEKDSERYSQCSINVSAGGRKNDMYHWTYLEASVTIEMIFNGEAYDIEVELGEMGVVNKEYTIKFKKPLSENEITSGYENVSARKYRGYICKDGELHDFSKKSVDREILTANKGDPCNEYTYTEDTCQKCGYRKEWGETPPAGHDIGVDGLCTKCGKTNLEINGSTADTTVEDKEPMTEADTEETPYLEIKHWAGNSSIACQPSRLGEENVEKFYVNDISLINYVIIESSNELVAKPTAARYPKDGNGLVEIPYTIEGYGEAIITVYINHNGEGGSTTLTLRLIVSQIGG